MGRDRSVVRDRKWQLKTVGQLFSARLNAAGYTIAGYTPDNGDAELVNLGQLKFVFRFDVALSEDGDSLPDWWEMAHFGNLNQADGGHYNGSPVDNLTAFRKGRDPAAGTVDGMGGAFPVGLMVYAP